MRSRGQRISGIPSRARRRQDCSRPIRRAIAGPHRTRRIEPEEVEHVARDVVAIVVRADHVIAVLQHDPARVGHFLEQEIGRAQARQFVLARMQHAMTQQQRDQRTHAHARDTQRVVLVFQRAILLGHRVEPRFRAHADQIVGARAVPRQRDHARVGARAPARRWISRCTSRRTRSARPASMRSTRRDPVAARLHDRQPAKPVGRPPMRAGLSAAPFDRLPAIGNDSLRGSTFPSTIPPPRTNASAR